MKKQIEELFNEQSEIGYRNKLEGIVKRIGEKNHIYINDIINQYSEEGRKKYIKDFIDMIYGIKNPHITTIAVKIFSKYSR